MQSRWQYLDIAEVILSDDMHGPNATIVTAITTIDADVDSKWVCNSIGERFAQHPRFRAIVDETTRKFVLVPNFDVRNHVTQHDKALCNTDVERILSTSLPLNLPYWHLHVFRSGTGTSKVVFRFHHVICDGTSIARFFHEYIVDKKSNSNPDAYASIPPRSKLYSELQVLGAEPTTWDNFTRPIRDVFASIAHPLTPDPCTYLTRSPLSLSKFAVWARKRNVIQLRVSTRALGMTINEVLIGALAGAVRKHFIAIGEEIPSGGLKCMVPVNMHPPADVSLWNAVTALILRLPVNDHNRHQRVATCLCYIRDMLAGNRVLLHRTLVNILVYLPKPLRIALWKYITRSASICLTNVTGPPNPVFINGHSVSGIQVLATGVRNWNVVCTAFSYAGCLELGICANPARLPQPHLFAQYFDAELDAILAWADNISG